jgi:hypothetical protein
VLTLPTVDTPFTVCKELPENKGVLLPSLSMDQKNYSLAVMLKLKISSVFLPAYLFRVKVYHRRYSHSVCFKRSCIVATRTVVVRLVLSQEPLPYLFLTVPCPPLARNELPVKTRPFTVT